jgi:hypothetical protein
MVVRPSLISTFTFSEDAHWRGLQGKGLSVAFHAKRPYRFFLAPYRIPLWVRTPLADLREAATFSSLKRAV